MSKECIEERRRVQEAREHERYVLWTKKLSELKENYDLDIPTIVWCMSSTEFEQVSTLGYTCGDCVSNYQNDHNQLKSCATFKALHGYKLEEIKVYNVNKI